MKKSTLNNSGTSHNGFVKHAGVITKLSKDSVIVTLTGNVNCASCHAKSSCGVSDSDAKTLEIFENPDSYELHENIDVIMGNDKGLKAVFFAYIFPFMILFLTLVISLNFLKEWQAGLLALFVLVPYYAILYFLNAILVQAFKVNLLKQQ